MITIEPVSLYNIEIQISGLFFILNSFVIINFGRAINAFEDTL